MNNQQIPSSLVNRPHTSVSHKLYNNNNTKLRNDDQ
jgi:hypothetical protein